MSSGFDFDDLEAPMPLSVEAGADRLSAFKARRKTASGKDAAWLDAQIRGMEYWLERRRQAMRSKSAATGQRR